jgi:hypothetical protein
MGYTYLVLRPTLVHHNHLSTERHSARPRIQVRARRRAEAQGLDPAEATTHGRWRRRVGHGLVPVH